jgi:hypothetical protein
VTVVITLAVALYDWMVRRAAGNVSAAIRDLSDSLGDRASYIEPINEIVDSAGQSPPTTRSQMEFAVENWMAEAGFDRGARALSSPLLLILGPSRALGVDGLPTYVRGRRAVRAVSRAATVARVSKNVCDR